MNYIEFLVKKAQKGNEKAFLQLFQSFEEQIYRTAYVYLNNQEDALDVVQETAYRSFKSIANLKEPKYFQTWIIRIAMSCSIDILRKRKKVIQLVSDYDEMISEEESENIVISVTLNELIDGLDENEKGVIILRYYYDYTIREVTEILDIPLGTGKTTLYRALKKLRRQAKEEQLYE